MHIVMITDYYLPTLGGIQTSVKAQKEALENAGHIVTVFCPSHKPNKDSSIVQLPTLKYIKPDGYPVAGPVKKVIASITEELKSLRDVDIVHVHSDMAAGVAGLISAKKLNIPVIQSMHGREDVYAQKILPFPSITSYYFAHLHNKYISHKSTKINRGNHSAQTITARRMWKVMVSQANYSDHIIVPSQHFANRLKIHGAIKPITLISNGLEDTVLERLKDVSPQVCKKNEKLKIMWCARISPEKRPLEFIEATLNFPDKVAVSMYGEGVLTKKAKSLIAKYQLQNRVRMCGGVSQNTILKAMRKHHVFISSSFDFDNQPMVILEAIAAGLPVIYCDPDLAEIMPRGGSILTQSPSPNQIAKTVQKLEQNRESITKMSRAMILYKPNIYQEKHVIKLIKTYRSVIKSKI